MSTTESTLIAEFWDRVSNYTPEQWSDMTSALARAALVRGETTAQYRDLREALNKVALGLDLVLEADPDPEHSEPHRQEIAISPDGNRDLFPVVVRIVDQAPDYLVQRYDIRACRPRIPGAHQLRVKTGSREWTAADLKWEPKEGHGKQLPLDVILYVPGYNPAVDDNADALRAAFLLLDAVLGEWAVMTHLREIEWRSDLLAAGKPGLPELAGFLDGIQAPSLHFPL